MNTPGGVKALEEPTWNEGNTMSSERGPRASSGSDDTGVKNGR
jgi:hypothetical protein